MLNDYERETYSYGELLDAENLPESVDRTNLQVNEPKKKLKIFIFYNFFLQNL